MVTASVYSRFLSIARERGNATAVWCAGESYSYSWLQQRSEQLAAVLLKNGVTPGCHVGVHLHRSEHLLVAILATIRCGATYVPMEPEYPTERLRTMLDDAQLRVRITQGRLAGCLPDKDCPVILADQDLPSVAEGTLPDPVCPDNLYVIYTSGSTGKPKGTLVRHAGAANLYDWYIREFGLDEHSRVSVVSSIGFDLTQKNLLAPLLCGGSVVLYRDPIYDPVRVRRCIREGAATTINCTPTAFYGLLDSPEAADDLASLRWVFLGGEPIATQRLKDWHQQPQCQARIVNSYGPTECSDVIAFHMLGDLSDYDEQPVPVGRPVDNVDLLILDEQNRPLADGQKGELCCGGIQVGAGYLNLPEATAQRFIDHPEFGRLYRTGDLAVRRKTDGEILFHGRVDHQVKLRGFRIELGEIEATLNLHAEVAQSAVLLREDTPGKPRLAAYIQVTGNTPPPASVLRRHLQQYVPDYMLPTSWTFLASMPQTANGKLDRKALPVPMAARPPLNAQYVTPTGALEKKLAADWEAQLGFPGIGANDPFFELGGTSIASIEFITRLSSELGCEIALVDFFAAPTIRGLATHLQQQHGEALAAHGLQEATTATRTARPARSRPQGGNEEPLAIVGMACRLPGADDVDQFWRNLRNGVESLQPVSRDHLLAGGQNPALLEHTHYVPWCMPLQAVTDFDAEFFGILPRDAEWMDPQHRLFLECGWSALEHAGHDVTRSNRRIGVFGGVARNGYLIHNLAAHARLREQSGEYAMMLANEKDFPASRLAFKLGLTGPAVSMQTACSSSGVAAHFARLALQAGDCDMALVGGARVMVPHHVGYLHVEGGTLSADGHVRAFDHRASGMIRGSGAAFVVLKRLADARADGDTIHGLLRSTAINNDGADKIAFAAPSVNGQQEVITAALEAAQLTADQIGYLEAHGTGTQLGDPIEITALTRAYRETTQDTGFCRIGSVKTNIGHLDAGAFCAGLIKATLAARDGVIPASLNFEAPNPQIRFDESPFVVADRQVEWQSDAPRRAGISSFGIGGTNVHAIVEQPPAVASAPASPAAPQLLIWSARTATARDAQRERLAKYLDGKYLEGESLDGEQPPRLQDAAHTLNIGRQCFSERAAAVALPEAGSLGTQVRKSVAGQANPALNDRIIFAFPGQGAQHHGMAEALYRRDADFRSILDFCAEQLRQPLGVDLIELLYGNNSADINDTRYAQPALFAVEYALARHWLAQGLRPAALIGHSLGEFVAATLAGIFTLEQALAIVSERARLMQDCPTGSMLALRASAEEAEAWTSDSITIAGYNAAKLCVLSGPDEAITALEAELEAKGQRGIRLTTSHAFHSPLMQPSVAPFRTFLEQYTLHPPQMPVISTVTGKALTAEQACSSDYWANQIIEPVRFFQAASSLVSEQPGLFLEVGPSQNLSGNLRRMPNAVTVPSLPPAGNAEADAASALLLALGQLWCHGIDIALPADETARRVPLPTYPFERQRYWVDPPAWDGAEQADSAAAEPVARPAAAESDNVATAQDSDLPLDRRGRIRELARGVLRNLSGIDIQPQHASATFVELGMDSLFLTQASAELQTCFSTSLSFRQMLEEIVSLDQLVDYLDARVDDAVLTPRDAAAATAETGARHRPGTPETHAQVGDYRVQTPSTQASGRHGPWKPVENRAGEQLTPSQQQYLDQLVADMASKTGKSRAYAQANRDVLSDPRSIAGFRLLWKDLVYQIVCERSDGPHIWDIDGNRYIDVTMGFGVGFLGHRPEYVEKAVAEQLKKGFEVGPQTPLAATAARKLCTLTGLERVSFCNTGSEAVMAALRMARTVTGRRKIVYFTGDYHGTFDEVLGRANVVNGELRTLPAAPGIAQPAMDSAILLNYGGEDAERSLQIIRDHAHEIAAVLVEPVQSRHPDHQPIEFVRALRELTRELDIALILDEVITGFRVHQRGIQALWGIEADIATYGKIIGGGLPIGAVAGKARFLDSIDGGHWQYGDNSVPEADVTFFAGTFVRHPLAMAAANAVLTYLEEQGPALQENLNALTTAFAEDINAFCEAEVIPLRVRHCSSWFRFDYPQELIGLNLLSYAMVRDGFYIREAAQNSFFSIRHSAADIQSVGEAIKRNLLALREAGFIPRAEAPAGHHPLTESQREIWLALKLNPEAASTYHQAIQARVKGKLDFDKLRQAAEQAYARHEALRLRFAENGESQRLCDDPMPEIAIHDLQGDDIDAQIQQWATQRAAEPFDLHRGPLMRLDVLRLADEEHVLVLVMHHLVSDGWSIVVFLEDLGKFYSGASPQDLPPALPFTAYVREERATQGSPANRQARQFWRDCYQDIPPPLTLPTDRPRQRGQAAATLHRPLSGPACQAAAGLARTLGVTPFATLFSAWQILMARLSGVDDIAIGVPLAGQSFRHQHELFGHLVSLLPVRSRLRDNADVTSLCKASRSAILDAHEHAGTTFGQIVQDLPLNRDPLRQPLVEVMFNLDPPSGGVRMEGCEVVLHETAKVAVLFDLFCNISQGNSYETGRQSANPLILDLDYRADLYDEATLHRWVDAYECLLLEMAANPTADWRGLRMSPAEALPESTTSSAASYRAIPALFAEMVEQHRDAPALIWPKADDERRLSYGELDALAGQLAGHLIENGVQPGDPVALCLPRGLEAIVAMLAVLKAGACYVPLDPEYPQARLVTILEDLDAPLRLVLDEDSRELPGTALIVDLNGDTASGATAVLPAVDADAPAYINYTSGSTGVPKGVIVPHRGVHRLVRDQDYATLDARTRVLHLASPAFDATTFEVWGALLNGGCCVLYPADGTPDPATLKHIVQAQGITTMWITASLFNTLVDEHADCLDGVQEILTGGEALSVSHVKLAQERLPDTQLINGYGPTEGTTFTCCHRIPSPLPDCDSIPIGQALNGTELLIVNQGNAACGVDEPGELWIGGAGVALGYWRRDELSAERFVERDGRRWYRSGDLVRRRASGLVEFIGRLDNQIKLRGFRIELSEIETALEGHPAISRAVCSVHRLTATDQRLVAYAVATDDANVTGTELRRYLQDRLPAYMLPQRFMMLDALPLNANGKLDRAALPSPFTAQSPEHEGRAPSDRIEATLLEIFGRLTGRPDILLDYSFTEAGGHSLLAVRAVAEIEAIMGVHLPAIRILMGTAATVAEECRQLGAVVPEPVMPEPVSATDVPAAACSTELKPETQNAPAKTGLWQKIRSGFRQ